MKILIDIGHPAHVHIFKNLAWILLQKGHTILFTTRDKENETYLLNIYKFNFICFGKNRKSKIGKILGLFYFNVRMLIVSIKFKPDIYLSHGSMYAAQIAYILRKPHISLEDSGNNEQIRLYAPFSKVIITPDFLPNDLGYKQIRYNANHEISYLHPNYYSPSGDIYKYLNIPITKHYAILRFVSWAATHDSGQSGLSKDEKLELVNYLKNNGLEVFISTERHQLPDDIKKYSIKIPSEKMHDALAYATIYIGEGATMASEAGVLGTPSIYISTIVRYYNEDQEKFGLVYNFRNFYGVLNKINEILSIENRKNEFQKRRQKFLGEKIDLTAFLVWFIENWPDSFNTMKTNPGYQLRFR